VYVQANILLVFGKHSLCLIMSVLTLALQILLVSSQTDSTYIFNSCATFDFEQLKRIEPEKFCQF
jgi:hypothetical protein